MTLTATIPAPNTITAPKGPYEQLPCPPSTPWGKAQQTNILMWGADPDGRGLHPPPSTSCGNGMNFDA